MDRKPSKNLNLPKGMRAKHRRQKVWYYQDTGEKPRKEIPLGDDYALAIKKWAELQINEKSRHAKIITFRYVAERYARDVIPHNTQRDSHKELVWLYKFFDNPLAPSDKIEPIHIRQYLDWRGNIRANREKALVRHQSKLD